MGKWIELDSRAIVDLDKVTDVSKEGDLTIKFYFSHESSLVEFFEKKTRDYVFERISIILSAEIIDNTN